MRTVLRSRGITAAGACAATVLMVLATVVAPAPAWAAPQIQLTASSTGTGPFDPVAGPGFDTSASDDVVRSRDSVVYTVQVLVDSAVTGSAVVFTVDGPATWEAIPPQCDPASSSIQGPVLTCATGNLAQQTFSLAPSVLVAGDAPNAATVAVTATFQSNETAPVTSSPAAVTVSAAPRWDLRKDFGSAQSQATVYGGRTGFFVDWPVTLHGPPTRKGSEAIASDTLTFVDDLSHLYAGLPPGSGTPQLVDAGPNGAGGVTLVRIPLGRSTTGAANSTSDSGTWDCAQAGTTLTCTVTGADLSMDHVPTQDALGEALPADTAIVVSGFIRIFVPKADLDLYALNASAALENRLEGFAPTSVTGQPNYGPSGEPGIDGTGNNVATTGVANFTSGASFKVYGADLSQTDVDPRIAPGGSTIGDGNGIVTAGQSFSAYMAFANSGTSPITNVSVCDAVDNTLNTATGQERVVGATSGYRYEYAATGPWASPSAQAGADCTDPAISWAPTPDAVPGGAGAVTLMRVVLDEVAIGAFVSVFFGLEAVPGLPNGSFLRNFGIAQSPDLPSAIRSSDPQGATDGMADHMLGVTALARVKKSTMTDAETDPSNPSDSVNVVQTGRTVTYSLQPSLTASSASGVAYPFTVRDVLPAGLRYVDGSASRPPTEVLTDPDGTTTLLWELGDLRPGETVAPITFRAQVAVTVADRAQLTNEVVVESPADASPEARRRATRAITTSNASGFAVAKSTTTPLIYPGQDEAYTLEVGNSTTTALTGLDIIDVLPHAGDATGSAFDGSNSIRSVDPDSPTAQVRYTAAPPTSVAIDPRHPSNAPGGSTTWCTAAQLGQVGCPTGLETATAFRVTETGSLPAQSGTRVRVVLSTSGNAGGDTYRNTFAAEADGLVFTVTSNVADVRVLNAAVGVQKQVCVSSTPADCDPADPQAWVPTQRIERGATAIWRIQVTNLGEVPLTEISVDDNLSGATSGPEPGCEETTPGPLEPGESAPAFTCTTEGVTGSVTNTVVATGTPQDPTAGEGAPVDSEPASASVTTPLPPTPTPPTPPAPPGPPGPPAPPSLPDLRPPAAETVGTAPGGLAATGAGGAGLAMLSLTMILTGAGVAASRRGRRGSTPRR